jgi:hypothetical protein
MSHDTLTANMPAPLLVGMFRTPGATHFLPLSEGELKRATDAMHRVLSSFEFEMGRNVVLASLLRDAAQFLPFEQALMASNLVSCNVDAVASDARRFESVIRRFNVAAVAALNGEILDGLESAGHVPETLLDGVVVWALPCAYERLRQHGGLKLRRWLEVGPALAVECKEGEGAHIDRFEWKVRVEDEELVLDSRLLRISAFKNFRTGVKGRVENTPCRCGNPDPRIIVDSVAP